MDTKTWLGVIDSMHATLVEAQSHREERNDFVTKPDGSIEIGWVAFELDTMHVAVNKARVARGLEPVDRRTIERVEQMACGHSDYSLKFSLYCAELSVDGTVPRP